MEHLILYLCIMYYTVCYLTGILYAVVRQIFMLFIDNKIYVFCILFSCNLPPALLTEWRDLLRATAVTRRLPKSTESWPWRRKLSRRSCRNSNLRPFSHKSGALGTELPAPRDVLNIVPVYFIWSSSTLTSYAPSDPSVSICLRRVLPLGV